MAIRIHLLLFPSLALLLLSCFSSAQTPGFLSLDCGGKENFTDELGLEWISDNKLAYGETSTVQVPSGTGKQYTTLRHFPADSRKYCYTLNVVNRTRYLLRASFLYGNFDNNNVYPEFDIYFGATHWSNIVISDDSTIETRELIFLATTSTVSVCLSNATTGQPFISTLELRQFNGSIYRTEYEEQFYLSVSGRINFGAESAAPIRYPDDSFDRIWDSDSIKREDYLVDVSDGAVKGSTRIPIHVDGDEMPPMKVMQTAVVGPNGSLSYQLNLEGFPGFGWACMYFAEIENLASNESRKFTVEFPGHPEIIAAIVNIEENAHGRYRLYELGFANLSLPLALSFRLDKTSDSSRGPLLNAMEINKYLKKNDGSLDGEVISGLLSHYSSADWAQEGGDPCLPVPWSWVRCSSDPYARVTSILLSNKNLPGNIPSEITELTGLVEIWLDGNMLTGPIPDFTGCMDLKIIHLENNQLTGGLPSSLVSLPNLRELYVHNNMLSGTVPPGLLSRDIILNYSGNINLHKESRKKTPLSAIIGSSVGAGILVVVAVVGGLFGLFKGNRVINTRDVNGTKVIAAAGEGAHRFGRCELEIATKNFMSRIGSGGHGDVFSGKLCDGTEIAVKVLANNPDQGEREFLSKVALLSGIRHSNLVRLLGYCLEGGDRMLVYELMQNGSLRELLDDAGPLQLRRSLNWRRRLRIAEDAAKGIEYIHTGRAPVVVHGDVKSANVLLDNCMRAKLSGVVFSKLRSGGTIEDTDPEFSTPHEDVYGFGVILLELISGQGAGTGDGRQNTVVDWAKSRIGTGSIQAIMDPSLGEDCDLKSVERIAVVAMKCVKLHLVERPSIPTVLKEIQRAISVEENRAKGKSSALSRWTSS